MTNTKKTIKKTTNAPPICIRSEKQVHHAELLELLSHRHQNCWKMLCMLRRSESHSVKLSFRTI